jgi:hypothetical protein
MRGRGWKEVWVVVRSICHVLAVLRKISYNVPLEDRENKSYVIKNEQQHQHQNQDRKAKRRCKMPTRSFRPAPRTTLNALQKSGLAFGKRQNPIK